MQPQEQDQLELRIQEIAYPGRGVARHEGLVCFVPGVLAGERISGRVTCVRKNYVEVELEEVLEASADRTSPACPLASLCPGCCYLHMSYEAEVRTKTRQLESLLRKFGGLTDIPEIRVVPSPQSMHYRNKIVLHAGKAGDDAVLGYFGRDNRSLIDVESCPLACAAITRSLLDFRESGDVPVPDRGTIPVTFRYTLQDGITCWHERPPQGLLLTEQTVLGPLEVPAGSFFQVNPKVCDLLITTVQTVLAESECRQVVDLYAGVGVFALAAAAAGIPDVKSVDSDRGAVASARRNASRLGAEQMQTHAMTALTALHKMGSGSNGRTETCIIVDPPRAGLEPESIARLTELRPGVILYISCAPDHLARDLHKLSAGGYRVRRVDLFDMFPRTAHFETLLVLEHAASQSSEKIS